MISLKRCLGLAALAFGVSLGATGEAHAYPLITFDDLSPSGNGDLIANGYEGFQWDNFYALNGASNNYNPSGYMNGVVSPENVAYNGFGDPATLSATGPDVFTFNSVYLTAAWNDGLIIAIDGYQGSVLVYSQTVTVDTHGPTLFNFNYANIDRLTFSSSGGTPNPAYTIFPGYQFVMDDLSINAVPEPSSVISAAFAAAAGLGCAVRRRCAA
jgi:hypothetical protein